MEKQSKIPALRFPDFKGEWEMQKFGNLTNRISNPVKVKPDMMYQQIGIRSHGKGIFHKEFIDGKGLGNKRVFWVKENALIVNIVFAWEQAVAKTTSSELGMIASHRFPMYNPIDDKSDLDYLLYFFLTKKGKSLLELASPGGAGRNKTLGQKEFENLKFLIPSSLEQKKIASFITSVNYKINSLKQKKILLEQYKKGVMQKIFNQEIRFKNDEGNEFEDWEDKKVKDIFVVTRGNVLSMSLVSDKQDDNNLYPVYSSQTKNNGLSGYFDRYLFEDCITWTTDGAGAGDVKFRKGKFYCTNVCGVLKSEEGYANVFVAEILNSVSRKYVSYVGNPKLMNNVMAEISISIPTSIVEQNKIASFLSAIDDKINHCQLQIVNTEQWKKGLLQKMFV
jgi:type I restriction enzyme S subunit